MLDPGAARRPNRSSDHDAGIMTLVVHVVAGTLALLAGYVALYSAKGARVHRKAGLVFVYAMVVMALVGALIAITRNKAAEGNVPVAFLTMYLVITALTTVRPRAGESSRLDMGMMVLVVAIAVTFFTFGAIAMSRPGRVL